MGAEANRKAEDRRRGQLLDVERQVEEDRLLLPASPEEAGPPVR